MLSSSLGGVRLKESVFFSSGGDSGGDGGIFLVCSVVSFKNLIGIELPNHECFNALGSSLLCSEWLDLGSEFILAIIGQLNIWDELLLSDGLGDVEADIKGGIGL